VRLDPEVVLAVPVLVFSVVVHECAHGLVALWSGDPTARDAGRLTLNPVRHADAVGSQLVPGLLLRAPIVIGWARPVPVTWANLRHPVNDQLKVALAGPLSNLLLAVTFGGLARLAPEDGPLAPLRLMGLAGVVLNAALALFNLIPIPPLDGAWVLMRFLPLRHIIALQHFRLVGLALVAVLLTSPAFTGTVVLGPFRLLVRGVLGLVGVPAAEAGL
jgi:Zn-dependent protease